MDSSGARPAPGTVSVPPPRPELVALAATVPENIKFGTSGWSADGWTGDVYHRVYRGAQPAARLNGRSGSTSSWHSCRVTFATRWSCATRSCSPHHTVKYCCVTV